ncbi:hypothetical protein [Shinella zoogloeoides]|uniref:hypothetical protein n=1 Tax=Shinella zoogloeoides TaxID=352475 RepID=UPI00299D159C|nr:hypothetical protein [Shinella zoogloeoides]
MKEVVQRLPPHFVQSINAIRIVSDMLRRSVKFILPNCAELLDPLHVSQAHEAPLPARCFRSSLAENRCKGRGLSRSLQVNPSHCPLLGARCNAAATGASQRHLDRFPQGGVFILPISWLDVIETWNVGIGGAFVPYENSLAAVDQAQVSPLSARAMEALNSAGLLPKKPA